MEIITVVLEKLGQDAIVVNANGEYFLDLQRVDCIRRGYNDQYELNLLVKETGKTKTGIPRLSIAKGQTEQERAAKKPLEWVGNGIILFRESGETQLP